MGPEAKECQNESKCSCVQIKVNGRLTEQINVESGVNFGRRLPVRGVIRWSCFVTTKKCPMDMCEDGETLDHLLIHCYRTVEIRQNVEKLGFDIKKKQHKSSKIWYI